MPLRPPFRLSEATLASAAVVALGVVACDGAGRAFGPTPAAARAQADDFFGGLAVRFADVQRAPKFAAARPKLARQALSPSRLWTDTSVWTGTAPSARWLELEGRPEGRRYLFLAHAAAPAPDRPGESRHVMRLTPTSDGAWQWTTAVDHAVGRVRAADVADAFRAGIAALGRADDGELRPLLRGGLPRTSAALGRLFDLAGGRATVLPDGSRLVELRARVTPEQLRATMPAFADYVRKWVHPSRVGFALTDGRADDRAARWLDVRLADDVVTVRLRARADGELLALEGAPRPMPDTVQFRTDARTHVMLFDVGVSAMTGELTTVRAPHERGWAVRWRRPPRWHIPLGMRHLMSGTLDRPFAREGMLLRLTLRDAESAQTLLVRRFDVAVQESAIVRWIGALGARAMDDFQGRVEAEENRFLSEALLALRSDLTGRLPAAD